MSEIDDARMSAMFLRNTVWSVPSSEPPRSVIEPGVSLTITPSYMRPSLVVTT